MPDASVRRKPARMSLIKLSTGDELFAQFNPTEFEEEVAVTFQRQKILGLSHTNMQYSNTENWQSPLKMHWEAFDDSGNKLDNLLAARRFIHSLCYGPRGAQDIVGGAPSRVLFIWPSLLSMLTFVTKIKFKFTQFNLNGAPVRADAEISIEEARVLKLFSEDVADEGTFRVNTPDVGIEI